MASSGIDVALDKISHYHLWYLCASVTFLSCQTSTLYCNVYTDQLAKLALNKSLANSRVLYITAKGQQKPHSSSGRMAMSAQLKQPYNFNFSKPSTW